MTRYLVLNGAALLVLALVAAPALRRLPGKPLLLAGAAVLALTALFDPLIVAAGIVGYDDGAILGLRIGEAPVEDLAYAVGAALLVPALWTYVGRTRAGDLAAVVVASRPFSWVNTAYPFAAAYIVATGGRLDAAFWVGTLYFLVPYNLLMYGVNDVFDYASDLRNPRKGGIEGGLVAPELAGAAHRRIGWAAAVTNVPLLGWLVALGDTASAVVLGGVVFAVLAYSLPVLRFKERPVLDSLTSATHFAGPLLFALVLAGVDLGAREVWPVLVGFVLWGMASHAFGAVQDVRADREGGIASVATVLGARATVRACVLGYLAAAATLLVAGWPAALAAAFVLPYAANAAVFWSIDDAGCERANAGWRRFLWLNLVVGFAVTMLLILA